MCLAGRMSPRCVRPGAAPHAQVGKDPAVIVWDTGTLKPLVKLQQGWVRLLAWELLP